MSSCDNLILVILWSSRQEDNKLRVDISCQFGGQYVFVPVSAVFIVAVGRVNTLQRVIVTHSCPTSKNIFKEGERHNFNETALIFLIHLLFVVYVVTF